MESEEQINAHLRELIITSKKYANDPSLNKWVRKQYSAYAKYLQNILNNPLESLFPNVLSITNAPNNPNAPKTPKTWKTIDEFVENPRAWKIFHIVRLFDANDFAREYVADLKLKGVRLNDIINDEAMFNYFIRAIQTHQS